MSKSPTIPMKPEPSKAVRAEMKAKGRQRARAYLELEPIICEAAWMAEIAGREFDRVARRGGKETAAGVFAINRALDMIRAVREAYYDLDKETSQ